MSARELALDDRQRRQRAKNWALLAVLTALAVLFYVITIVRVDVGLGP
jgi:predicted anti-sigma-YlaC factor YlaD